MLNALGGYPGTPQHQALLRAIAAYYADDPRILAVGVFGSLGRGTWDRYSDLDVDIVTVDGERIDVVRELEQLCASFASIGEKAALIIPDGDDAGDVVLESLMELSIRYHPLGTTSPNIVDSLCVLMGRIDLETIQAAGLANRRLEDKPLQRFLDRLVRYAVEADVALGRGQIWGAVELLHRMRGLLMELFARTHRGVRSYHVFQAQADEQLQTRLGATLPQYDLLSAQQALLRLLGILEHDLDAWTGGRVWLRDIHYELIGRVRARQAQQSLHDKSDRIENASQEE